MFLAKDANKKELCRQLKLRVWSGQQAISRMERTDMAVVIVEEKALQFVSSNGEVSCKPVLLLYKYYIIIIIINKIISLFLLLLELQIPVAFLFKIEVRELPTIYSTQGETDTSVVMYLHPAAAPGYNNALVRILTQMPS